MNGSVPLQLAAGPQKFIPGPTICSADFIAFACKATQSAAACAAVRFACDMKFGSLKPSRNCEPAGIVPLTVLAPHTIGTNSIPVLPPDGLRLQLYHQPTAGKNAAPGAVLAAMPRLQVTAAPPAPPDPPRPAPAAPPFPPAPLPAVPPHPVEPAFPPVPPEPVAPAF